MSVENDSKVAKQFEANQDRWDTWAKTYDSKRFDFLRYFQRKVIEIADLKEGQAFLDIGCGTGWAVCYAASLLKENGQFHGIDMSEKMIEKALENSRSLDNTHFHRTTADHLPFEDNTFDLAICSNSFNHYLEPLKSLVEIRRVLKPGGRFYIIDATPDGIIIKMIEKVIASREPSHVKLYSTKEFQELFAQAGFKYAGTRPVLPEKVHIAEKPL